MSCPVCTKLSVKRMRSIDRHLTEGKKSLMAIAEHFGVAVGDLRKHLVTCVEGQGVTHEEELVTAQRQLGALIQQFQQDVADGQHLRFVPEDGIDGRSTISNLLSALREQRETVMALAKLHSSDEIYQGLHETVVSPLIRATVQICTEECRRLREELFDLTKTTPEQQPRIRKAVDAVLLRIGDRMSTEAIHDIQDKVQAVVNQKQGRRAAPLPH